MAFMPYSYEGGQMPPFEYHKLGEGRDITVGLCMTVTDGKAAPSVTPQYICLREELGAAADTLIPMMHIGGGAVFEAPLEKDSAELAPGSLADVAADGLSIASAGENRNVFIISMDGAAQGDLCRCRFV